MSITGINSATSTFHIRTMSSVRGGDTSGSSGVGSTSGSNDIQISKPAEMLSKLQQLQSEDPEKLKKVLQDIAGKLSAAAQQQGQSPQGNFLSQIADKFKSAAETGDLSALQPPAGGGGPAEFAKNAYAAQGAQGAFSLPSLPDFNDSSKTSDSTIKALFDSIEQEISSAVAK